MRSPLSARKRKPATSLSRRARFFRILLVALAAVAGLKTVGASLAATVAKVDAGRAYALSPGDGVIAARHANELFVLSPEMDAKGRIARLARQALVADPTAASAVTLLAFQAELRGERQKSAELFEYSTHLSRRELRSRLWAIEEAVTRGDISSALHNYDLALRTSQEAGPMLYPTLGAAMAEPRIRQKFLQVLKRRPVWKDEFLDHVARRRINPEGLASLLSEGRDIGLHAADDVKVQIADALLADGRTDRAWSVYQTLRGNVRRDRSRDSAFALATETRSAFDWRAGDDSRLGAAILTDGKAGAIDFAAGPDASGLIAEQQQLLPPGSYRLSGRSRAIEQAVPYRPYWSLACADGRELGRIEIPASATNNGRFSGTFTVPGDCLVQRLQFMARASSGTDGNSGQIITAYLEPVR